MRLIIPALVGVSSSNVSANGISTTRNPPYEPEHITTQSVSQNHADVDVGGTSTGKIASTYDILLLVIVVILQVIWLLFYFGFRFRESLNDNHK